MPIYEYRCKECEEEFEKEQKITDDTIPNCLKCGGECIKKISRSLVIFKGPGFYVNDYKKNKIKQSKE